MLQKNIPVRQFRQGFNRPKLRHAIHAFPLNYLYSYYFIWWAMHVARVGEKEKAEVW